MRKNTGASRGRLEALKARAKRDYQLQLRNLKEFAAIVPASPKEIKATRAKLEMNQATFADWLTVSIRTVQCWEQGIRHPESMTSRIIRLAAKDRNFVKVFASPDLNGDA